MSILKILLRICGVLNSLLAFTQIFSEEIKPIKECDQHLFFQLNTSVVNFILPKINENFLVKCIQSSKLSLQSINNRAVVKHHIVANRQILPPNIVTILMSTYSPLIITGSAQPLYEKYEEYFIGSAKWIEDLLGSYEVCQIIHRGKEIMYGNLNYFNIVYRLQKNFTKNQQKYTKKIHLEFPLTNVSPSKHSCSKQCKRNEFRNTMLSTLLDDSYKMLLQTPTIQYNLVNNQITLQKNKSDIEITPIICNPFNVKLTKKLMKCMPLLNTPVYCINNSMCIINEKYNFDNYMILQPWHLNFNKELDENTILLQMNLVSLTPFKQQAFKIAVNDRPINYVISSQQFNNSKHTIQLSKEYLPKFASHIFTKQYLDLSLTELLTNINQINFNNFIYPLPNIVSCMYENSDSVINANECKLCLNNIEEPAVTKYISIDDSSSSYIRHIKQIDGEKYNFDNANILRPWHLNFNKELDENTILLQMNLVSLTPFKQQAFKIAVNDRPINYVISSQQFNNSKHTIQLSKEYLPKFASHIFTKQYLDLSLTELLTNINQINFNNFIYPLPNIVSCMYENSDSVINTNECKLCLNNIEEPAVTKYISIDDLSSSYIRYIKQIDGEKYNFDNADILRRWHINLNKTLDENTIVSQTHLVSLIPFKQEMSKIFIYVKQINPTILSQPFSRCEYAFKFSEEFLPQLTSHAFTKQYLGVSLTELLINTNRINFNDLTCSSRNLITCIDENSDNLIKINKCNASFNCIVNPIEYSKKCISVFDRSIYCVKDVKRIDVDKHNFAKLQSYHVSFNKILNENTRLPQVSFVLLTPTFQSISSCSLSNNYFNIELPSNKNFLHEFQLYKTIVQLFNSHVVPKQNLIIPINEWMIHCKSWYSTNLSNYLYNNISCMSEEGDDIFVNSEDVQLSLNDSKKITPHIYKLNSIKNGKLTDDFNIKLYKIKPFHVTDVSNGSINNYLSYRECCFCVNAYTPNRFKQIINYTTTKELSKINKTTFEISIDNFILVSPKLSNQAVLKNSPTSILDLTSLGNNNVFCHNIEPSIHSIDDYFLKSLIYTTPFKQSAQNLNRITLIANPIKFDIYNIFGKNLFVSDKIIHQQFDNYYLFYEFTPIRLHKTLKPSYFHYSKDIASRVNKNNRATFYQLATIPLLEELQTDSVGDEFKIEAKAVRQKNNEECIVALNFTPYNSDFFTPIPHHIYYILDQSTLIEKERFSTFKKSIKQSLQYLNDNVYFNVIAFDQQINKFNPHELMTTKTSISSADKYIDDITQCRHSSSTKLFSILEEIKQKAKNNDDVYSVILLTNGHLMKNIRFHREALHNFIKDKPENFFVHTTAVSDDNNLGMLNLLAQLGGGEFLYSQTHAAFPRKLSIMMKKIRRPILTNITITPINAKSYKIEQVDKCKQPLFADKSYTTYLTTNCVDDLNIIIQGYASSGHYINIQKQIYIKNIVYGGSTCQKEVAKRRVLSYVVKFLLSNDNNDLQQAIKIAHAFNLPFPAI